MKSIRYIVILLFSLLSVCMGVLFGGCKVEPDRYERFEGIDKQLVTANNTLRFYLNAEDSGHTEYHDSVMLYLGECKALLKMEAINLHEK